MKVLRSISAARATCRGAALPLVLVPTMGALHAGHAALLQRARKLAGAEGTVIVSVFVNPTQFGPKEDFSRYPRTLARDRQLCWEQGADLIFHPRAEEMYLDNFSTWVQEERVSSHLCGASRPGHFRGVTTVVLKLFLITQATHAVFGRKDFQQCAVIRRMVRDLDVPIQIETVETVREPDGLALSSRNTFLSPEERAQAPILRQALLAARDAFLAGEKSAAALRRGVVRRIGKAPAARVDYIELADAESLEPVQQITRRTVIALAVFFGQTRLIDNLVLTP